MLTRPCSSVPPGAPCPTHDDGTWPERCVCYCESRGDLSISAKVGIALTVAGFLAFFTVLLFAITAKAADNDAPCLTLDQARKKWPGVHLWYSLQGDKKCWSDERVRSFRAPPARAAKPSHVRYSVNRNPLQLPKPALDANGMAIHHSGAPLVVFVSEDEFTDLDAQADKGPSIFYPALLPGLPVLILEPREMTGWPLLVDIDVQQVFTPWEFRIAGAFER